MMTTTQTHTLEYVLDGLPHLRLNNHKGDVRVTHDADPGVVRIALHAHRPVSFDAVQERVDGTNISVTIPQLAEPEGGTGFTFRIGGLDLFSAFRGTTVDVEVHLPGQAGLALETGAGDISVSGDSGSLSAKSGSGDLRVSRAQSVALHAGAGDVSTGVIGGGSLKTGSGDIRIERTTADTDINSGTGDVSVLDAAGALRITTGAGDVTAMLSSGRIDVRTGMGDVNIQVPTGVAVWQDLTTGVGEVRSRVQSMGEPEPGEPFVSVTARTGAGDVSLSH